MAGKSAGLKPAQKVLGILGIALLLLIGGASAYYLQPKWVEYKNDAQHVKFIYPEGWQASGSNNLITVVPNSQSSEKSTLMIRIDPAPIFADDIVQNAQGQTITVGSKTASLFNREAVATAGANKGKTFTFTQMYWKDRNDRGYIFEISPWQKDKLDANWEKIISSFATF